MSDILDKLNNLEHNLNLLSKKIDSTAIDYILLHGDVDFGKSNQRKKPCPEYSITGEFVSFPTSLLEI